MVQSILLLVHVLTGVLGVGQIAAVAAIASAASSSKETLRSLSLVVRGATWSLVIMFLTGGALDGVSHGIFHGTWWFRISTVLLLLLGFLFARMQRTLRMLDADKADLADVRARFLLLARIVIAAVLVITGLMVLKPW
jgi:hypothetical protein